MGILGSAGIPKKQDEEVTAGKFLSVRTDLMPSKKGLGCVECQDKGSPLCVLPAQSQRVLPEKTLRHSRDITNRKQFSYFIKILEIRWFGPQPVFG